MISVMTVFREDHGFIAEAIEYENGKVFMQWRVEPIATNLFKSREDFEAELDRRYPDTKDETIIRILDIDTTDGLLTVAPVEFMDLELLLQFLFGKQANRLKIFTIIRQADETGISGTGHVITGMVFSNGLTNLNWISDNSSNSTFDSWDAFLAIHIQAHPNNDTIINELELKTDKEGEIEVLEKDYCSICYEPIYPQMRSTGWTHQVFAKNIGHTAVKAESKRQPGESCDDCVKRKIPIIAREKPNQDNDQNVAIAFSICGCSKSEKEAGKYKTKDYDIIQMRPFDLKQVLNLQTKTMPEPYDMDSWETLLKQNRAFAWVARSQTELLGYVIGKQTFESIGQVGHVLSIAVDKNLQQKGVGGLLLTRLMNSLKIKKISMLTLTVRDYNTTAIEFYKKNGFYIAGQQKEFYPNKDNGIFMSKIL